MGSLAERVEEALRRCGDRALRVPGKRNAEILREVRRAERVECLRPEAGVHPEGTWRPLPWTTWVEWQAPEIGASGVYGWLMVPDGVGGMSSYPYWSIDGVPVECPNARVLASCVGGTVEVGFEALDPEADRDWLVDSWMQAYATAVAHDAARPDVFDE